MVIVTVYLVFFFSRVHQHATPTGALSYLFNSVTTWTCGKCTWRTRKTPYHGRHPEKRVVSIKIKRQVPFFFIRLFLLVVSPLIVNLWSTSVLIFLLSCSCAPMLYINFCRRLVVVHLPPFWAEEPMPIPHACLLEYSTDFPYQWYCRVECSRRWSHPVVLPWIRGIF